MGRGIFVSLIIAMAALVPSDIYPAVRKFLLENGLARALKAFDKETSFDETAPATASHLGKKAKKLAKLELTAACQSWLDSSTPVAIVGETASAAPLATLEEEPTTTTKAKKRRREPEATDGVEAEQPDAEAEELPKK